MWKRFFRFKVLVQITIITLFMTGHYSKVLLNVALFAKYELSHLHRTLHDRVDTCAIKCHWMLSVSWHQTCLYWRRLLRKMKEKTNWKAWGKWVNLPQYNVTQNVFMCCYLLCVYVLCCKRTVALFQLHYVYFVCVSDVYLCAVLVCCVGLLCMCMFTIAVSCQYLQRNRRLKGLILAVEDIT